VRDAVEELVTVSSQRLRVPAALRRPWARGLLRWTGVLVAVGFLLDDALGVRSRLTFPYWGAAMLAGSRGSDARAIVMGTWCAVAGTARQTGDGA
jgi:hypothetical protein